MIQIHIKKNKIQVQNTGSITIEAVPLFLFL